MSVFKDQNDENRWFCRSRWHFYLHQPIPSEKEMDMMLVWLAVSAETLETNLSDSAFGVQLERGQRQLYLKNS